MTTPVPDNAPDKAPPSYRADLDRDSLPEMLQKIRRHRVPGVIHAQHAEVTKSIFIKDGSVIYASSSDLGDSLGAHLLREGVLSHDTLRAVAKERARSEKRFGVLLMERGTLSPRALNQAIRQQIERIAWSLFSWSDGEVSFLIKEIHETNIVRIQIPLGQLIFRGIKRAPDPKPLVERLGTRQTVFEPHYSGEEIIDLALDSEEYSMLKLVDGKTTVYELAKSGPYDIADNARLLYAYKVLQLIREREGDAPGGKRIRLQTAGASFSV